MRQNVIVYPSRAVAIENALRLFSPQLAIVDENLSRQLPKQWLTSLGIEVGSLSLSLSLVLYSATGNKFSMVLGNCGMIKNV